MPVTYGSHTPAHIAALFDTVISYIAPKDDNTSIPLMLCTSLPETIDPHMQYVCLTTEAPHAVQGARISYIMPPISLAALTAQITAWLHAPQASFPLAHGWVLNATTRLLEHAQHAPVILTELECSLLTHMARNTDQEMGRDQLMRDVWRYEDGTQTHTLETHMYRLRGKLEKLSPSACQIDTTDAGYRLSLA